MKKNLLFIIFSLIVGSVFSQVPGYVGKRFHLQGGVHFFPQLGSVPVNIVQPRNTYAISGMNYRLVLGMDFVISRKSTIGLNGHYFNTAGPLEGLYIDKYSSSPNPDIRYSIEGGAVGFVFKTHFGSWVAPLGPYFKLEAGGIFNSVSDPANNYGGAFLPETYGSGYLTFGFGRTHIFANRLSLDYGFEMGTILPPVGTFPGSAVNLRMTVHYLATFYIKMGVVL